MSLAPIWKIAIWNKLTTYKTMKHIILTTAALALLLASCKKKSDPEPEDPAPTTTAATTTGGTTTGGVNTGPLNIYVVDTAKVNTISETGTGESTIINKTVNSSSYIMDFCPTMDGNKLVYGISQSNFSGPTPVYTKELRIADKNGSNDALLYTIPGGTTYIGCIKAGTNNKVYYTVQNFPNNTMYAINTDGTANTQVFQWNGMIDNISTNSTYLMCPLSTSNKVQIIDRTGDGGFGSLYHNEDLTASGITNIGHGCFSYDSQKAFIPYNESGTLKMRVIDMATKTSTTKTISNISVSFPQIFVRPGSDGDRVIITVSDNSSVSYIYKISAGTVTSFTNNDKNVALVYPF
jgi:hypothetical protein